MKKLFEEINKEALNKEEKSKILSNLKTFLLENPVQKIPSPFYNSWHIFRQRNILVPSILILILVITSSSAFASNTSLPGDILYPIKILGENIQSLTAVGTKARAQVIADHAITRLMEVEKLASTGKLDSKKRQEIENKFESQTQETLNDINNLKNNGDLEDASTLNSDFKQSLTEHEKNISDLLNHENTQVETRKELNNVIKNIRSKLDITSDNRDDLKKTSERLEERKDNLKTEINNTEKDRNHSTSTRSENSKNDGKDEQSEN